MPKQRHDKGRQKQAAREIRQRRIRENDLRNWRPNREHTKHSKRATRSN